MNTHFIRSELFPIILFIYHVLTLFYILAPPVSKDFFCMGTEWTVTHVRRISIKVAKNL